MALPKIKYPTYTFTIPSTEVECKYRPFTVAEEKILLTAMQGEDATEIQNAIEDIISVCFTGSFDVTTLTSYDVESMFIKLRAKSISNVVQMDFRNKKCPDNDYKPCERSVNVSVDIEQATVQQYDPNTQEYQDYKPEIKVGIGTNIELDDGIGVIVRHPGLKEISEAEQHQGIEQLNTLIKNSIKAVYDEEEVHDKFSVEELNTFFDSLTAKHKEKLAQFITNTPKLRYVSKFVCTKCGYEEPIIFEGLESFFG